MSDFIGVVGRIFQYVLDTGAGVFLPIIMIILGLIVRMPLKKAFSAALTLGVAFIGMNVVIGFMTGAISPAATALVENTGRQLTTIDMGWTPIAAISWLGLMPSCCSRCRLRSILLCLL